MGKSALTWQWATTRAPRASPDLAGTFWFSFYERGATMAACLRHALAYVTGRPPSDLRGRRAPDLAEELLDELRRKPYLLVLDGLERILVAYHRMDAAQIRDDQVESDQRSCIDPADREVLRRLTACTPSRVLVSTRLFPRALENRSHRPLPGVARKELRGLAEGDAAEFMAQAGIVGNRSAILRFTGQFEHHPLVLGLVAGVINDYPPEPGSFDRWHADPEYGGRLELSDVNLTQRHNHILYHALRGLDPQVRQVLARVAAVFPSAVDYETLAVINPFATEPSEETAEQRARFDRSLQVLKQRGLLQFDRTRRAYDMHPVVRGYADGLLEGDERLQTFSTVADYFQSRPADRYEDAKDLADLQNSLAIYRALVGAEKYEKAYQFYRGQFSHALCHSCEANATVAEMLSTLFQQGLGNLPVLQSARDQSELMADLSIALLHSGETTAAARLDEQTLRINLKRQDVSNLLAALSRYGANLSWQNSLARAHAALRHELALSNHSDSRDEAKSHVDWMKYATLTGQWKLAARSADEFRRRPRPGRNRYRIGELEFLECRIRFCRQGLEEGHLSAACQVASKAKSRRVLRELRMLGGELELELDRPTKARDLFGEALVMAQKAGAPLGNLRVRLALACARLGDHRRTADLLAECDEGTEDWRLAEAWLALGDREKALEHGLRGYEWAWADGPPHVNWWPLQRMEKLLAELEVEPPDLPPFDPNAVEPLPYEDEIVAFIEELEAEQREREENEKGS